MCVFALALHPDKLCSAQLSTWPPVLSCSQGDVSLCATVCLRCQPALSHCPSGTHLSLLRQVQPHLSLCCSFVPALSPALEQLLTRLSSAPQSFPHGPWLAFSTTLSLWCRSPPHVPTLHPTGAWPWAAPGAEATGTHSPGWSPSSIPKDLLPHTSLVPLSTSHPCTHTQTHTN